MRVLFTCYPERTHFLLMAPLAWALRTAGHDVRVAVQPKFTGVVTQAGLTAVPVGNDRDLWEVMYRMVTWLGDGGPGWPVPYDAAELPAGEVTWEHLRDGYQGTALRWHKTSNVPMITDLVDFAREWRPDLVLWEPTTYAGAVAAKACGAAHGRMLIGADVYGITRGHFLRLLDEQPAHDRFDPMGHWLGSYGKKYDFAFGEDLVTGQFTINQLPPSVAVNAAVTNVPMRNVPYGGTAIIPQWLSSPPERPRVALTMGLTITDRDAGFPVNVQDILDSVADLDVEVVVTARREQLERVPCNARVVPYVPLTALLPTCSAIIHHAGVGTLTSSVLYGVPQLALPWDVDQPALADRLAAQGGGLAVHATKASGQIVRDCLVRLLDEPEFRRGAERLREEMLAMPTPNELVPHLVQLTAQHRRNE